VKYDTTEEFQENLSVLEEDDKELLQAIENDDTDMQEGIIFDEFIQNVHKGLKIAGVIALIGIIWWLT